MSINKRIALICLTLGLSACSINEEWFITHNGNMPTNDRIKTIHKGQDKTEVEGILGAPSTIVSLDQNTWIYMSADVKRVAFFAPEEINRDVLTIKFNKDDKVSSISRNGKEAGVELAVAEEKTETYGHKKGFFEKFFGGTQTYAPMGGASGDGL